MTKKNAARDVRLNRWGRTVLDDIHVFEVGQFDRWERKEVSSPIATYEEVLTHVRETHGHLAAILLDFGYHQGRAAEVWRVPSRMSGLAAYGFTRGLLDNRVDWSEELRKSPR